MICRTPINVLSNILIERKSSSTTFDMSPHGVLPWFEASHEDSPVHVCLHLQLACACMAYPDVSQGSALRCVVVAMPRVDVDTLASVLPECVA